MLCCRSQNHRQPRLAAWLAGLRSAKELGLSALRGPLFETWAVAEVMKLKHHLRLDARLFFWRDKIGSEVDVLIERGAALQSVEINLDSLVERARVGRWRTGCCRSASVHVPAPTPVRPVLVYGGVQSQTRAEADICPWQQGPQTALQLLQNQ